MNQVVRSIRDGTIDQYMEWQRQNDFLGWNLSDPISSTHGLIVHTNPYELRYGLPATIAMM